MNPDTAKDFLLHTLQQLEKNLESLKVKYETCQEEVLLVRKTFGFPATGWSDEMKVGADRHGKRAALEQIIKFTPRFGNRRG